MTRPHGTPAALSSSIQCAVVAVISRASIAAFIAARCWSRRSLEAKRGSARNSGICERIDEPLVDCSWLGASATSPSWVRNMP
jgi:hypothetical protein